MAKINKFEDMLIWQKARIVVKHIYDLTSKDNLKKGFCIKESDNQGWNFNNAQCC